MSRDRRGRAKRRKDAPKVVAFNAPASAFAGFVPPPPVEITPEAAENPPSGETADGFDTFEPFLAPPRRPRRAERVVRGLLYMGIALAVALLVFSVINIMESRDLAPRTISAP